MIKGPEDWDQLLENLRAAKDQQLEDALKSITNASVPGTATQYQPFNLDPIGKVLTPEFTPFSNGGYYDVKTGESGDSFEYRAIVAKNTKKSGGAALAATAHNFTTQAAAGRANIIDFDFLTRKKFRAKHAPEAAIDWELYETSGPFNALGKTIIVSLINAREIEERRILWDDSTALATPGKPVAAKNAAAGNFTNVAYTVKVIALNYWGWRYWIEDGVLPVADIVAVTSFGLPGANATQGESIGSVASDAVTPDASASVDVSVAPVKGAYGYIWVAATASTYKLCAATEQPRATLSNVSSLTITVPSVDGSTFDLDGFPVIWDGLFAQIARDADIPGYFKSLDSNGTPGTLSTYGAGSGCLELEEMFQSRSKVTKTPFELLIMSPSTLGSLSNIVIGSSAPAYRLNIDAQGGGGKGNVIAGTILKAVYNQYMDKVVPLMAHPLMPNGKIIGYQKTVDYPNSGVGANLELHCTKRFQQQYFALTADVAPPGPWAIKSYGAPCLIWGKACGVLDDIA
jgi:hypothetical protein